MSWSRSIQYSGRKWRYWLYSTWVSTFHHWPSVLIGCYIFVCIYIYCSLCVCVCRQGVLSSRELIPGRRTWTPPEDVRPDGPPRWTTLWVHRNQSLTKQLHWVYKVSYLFGVWDGLDLNLSKLQEYAASVWYNSVFGERAERSSIRSVYNIQNLNL